MLQLKQLLLHELFTHKDKSQKPLFVSQKELAESIVGLSQHYSNVKSLRAFLSQILNDTSGKSIPANLYNVITDIAEQRLSDPHIFIAEFANATKDKSVDMMLPEKAWNNCLESMEKCSLWYIFTKTPAEVYWESHDSAKVLTELTVKKLLSFKTRDTDFKCLYFFPRLKLALTFWASLKKYMIQFKHCSEKECDSILKELNDLKLITVQITHDDFATVPSLLYFTRHADNPASSKNLFSISYLPSNETSICQYSEDDTEHWLSNTLVTYLYSHRSDTTIPVPSDKTDFPFVH